MCAVCNVNRVFSNRNYLQLILDSSYDISKKNKSKTILLRTNGLLWNMHSLCDVFVLRSEVNHARHRIRNNLWSYKIVSWRSKFPSSSWEIRFSNTFVNTIWKDTCMWWVSQKKDEDKIPSFPWSGVSLTVNSRMTSMMLSGFVWSHPKEKVCTSRTQNMTVQCQDWFQFCLTKRMYRRDGLKHKIITIQT